MTKDKKHLDEQIDALKDALDAQNTRLEEEIEQAKVDWADMMKSAAYKFNYSIIVKLF